MLLVSGLWPSNQAIFVTFSSRNLRFGIYEEQNSVSLKNWGASVGTQGDKPEQLRHVFQKQKTSHIYRQER